VVSAGGRGPPVVGAYLVVKVFLVVGVHRKGLAPSPLTHFSCLSRGFPKVLKNESLGGGEESWWSHIPPPKASAEIPCLHDI